MASGTQTRLSLAALCVSLAEGARRGKPVEPEIGTWPSIDEQLQNVTAYFASPMVVTTLVACFSVLFISPAHKRFGYLNEFLKEFLGMIVMVICTFTPGPFLGSFKGYEEWLAHVAGVIVADYLCGGPHVNPAVTVAMFVWRKVSLYQVLLYIAAQMAGSIIAFPLLQSIATPYKAVIGGPEVGPEVSVTDGALCEGTSTFLLMLGIYVFATTAIGKIYPVKQPLIAACIRACIFFFGTTGPAMNPALATSWAFYQSQSTSFPSDLAHYLIYWMGAIGGASLATFVWSAVSQTGPMADPHAYSPGSIDAVWQHHMDCLVQRDMEGMLLDFAPYAKVTVSDVSDPRATGQDDKTGVKEAFMAFFSKLKGMRAEDVVSGDTDTVDGKVVLHTWRAPSRKLAHATAMAVVDADLKIVRYSLSYLFK